VVSVQIFDDLSGLDDDQVFYRYRKHGDEDHSEWYRIPGQSYDGVYQGNIRPELTPGSDNILMIRATDLSGNEVVTDEITIWVNSPPTAVIASPSPGGPYNDNVPTFLSARGSFDPDGDDLVYVWYLDGITLRTIKDREGDMLLPPGSINISLKVIDPMGAESQAEVQVEVEHLEPPRTAEGWGSFPWFVIVFLFIAGTLLAYVIVHRARSSQGT